MYIPYKTDIYIYIHVVIYGINSTKFWRSCSLDSGNIPEYNEILLHLIDSNGWKSYVFRGQISFSALKQSWPENHHLRSVLAIIVPLKKLLDGSTPRLLQRKEMSKTELGSQTWWVVNAYGWNPIRMFWNTRFATYWAFVKDLIHQSMFSGKFGRHKISEASTGKPPKEVKGLPGNGKGERLQGRRPASLVVYCLQ